MAKKEEEKSAVDKLLDAVENVSGATRQTPEAAKKQVVALTKLLALGDKVTLSDKIRIS